MLWEKTRSFALLVEEIYYPDDRTMFNLCFGGMRVGPFG